MSAANGVLPREGNIAEPLFTGKIKWTNNEDAVKRIVVPPLEIPIGESLVVHVRNSSKTVDITAIMGEEVLCHPTGTDASKVWTAVGATSTDAFAATAHGLAVGDALEVLTTSSTCVTAGQVLYVTGSDAATDITANEFRLAASPLLGTVVDVVAPTTLTLKTAPQFYVKSAVLVEKVAVASGTVAETGKESIVVEGWGRNGGVVKLAKSAATAGVMNASIVVNRA